METGIRSASLNRAPPEVLYHYCSTDTFSKILEHKTIRLSDLSVSNDSMEGKLAMDALIQNCLRAGLPLDIIVAFKRMEIEQNWLGSRLGLCLTEEQDSLSQWRGYADDGFGFCIGFSTEFLSSIAPPIPVAYTTDEHTELLATVTTMVRDSWSQELSHVLSLKGDDLEAYMQVRQTHVVEDGREHWLASKIENDYHTFFNALFELSLLGFHIKGSAFAQEKEWRLLANLSSQDERRVARDRIAPFRAYDIPPMGISRVVIGPNNRTPPAVVRSLFSDQWVDVIRSEATYRS